MNSIIGAANSAPVNPTAVAALRQELLQAQNDLASHFTCVDASKAEDRQRIEGLPVPSSFLDAAVP